MRKYEYLKNDGFGNYAGNCKRRIASSYNVQNDTNESSPAEEGKVVFNAIANEKHLNPQGGVHRGFSAKVLDSVTGCAVHTPSWGLELLMAQLI